MDTKRASGMKAHFYHIVGTTPIRIVGVEAYREAILFVNEGPATVRLGLSGSYGVGLPSAQGLTDNYTRDEYWAWTTASSGTLSGFIVR